MTLKDRIEQWKTAYDEGIYGEVEAFLSLYYLATFMEESIATAIRMFEEVQDQAAINAIQAPLKQNEEER